MRADAPDVVVVVAGGLGYLTEAAAAKWPDAVLVVVEPLRALADAARARTPALYASGRVHVLAGPEYAGADDLWRVFDSPRSTGAAPAIVAHPGLGRAMPTLTREAAAVVGRAVAAARMNAQARAENAGRYVVNTIRNLRHVVRGPNPERLRGRCRGVPAVVVGAGPSLDQNASALRALEGRALIIATDTAWRPLVTAGVSPHLVVALDPTIANGRHLMGVTARRDTWIVAEGSVDPVALAGLSGRVAAFRVGAHHPWPWLQQLGVDRLLLRAWGSVLTSAFDLALVCGCDPIVFVGADLGFTGGQPYCRGTSMETEWARHTARGVSLRQVWDATLASRPLVSEPGVTGEAVPTAPHLVEFRNWLVARAADTPGRVVNASGGGIFVGPHVRQATLADVLAPYADRDDWLREVVNDSLNMPADQDQPNAVADALRRVAQGDAPHTSVTEWVTFGRPTLTAADVQSAAQAGAAALVTNGPTWTPTETASPLRWHAADRVAAMRARLTGEPSVLDGGTPRLGAEVGSAATDAMRLIDELLQEPTLVTAVGDDVSDGAAPDLVPLSCRFVWTPTAAPRVARLEEALVESAVPAAIRASVATDDYWNEPIVPVMAAAVETGERDGLRVGHADGQSGDHIAREPDRAARAALLGERLTLTSTGAATGSVREQRLAAAVMRALADPALAAPAAAPLSLSLSRSLSHRPGLGSAPVLIDGMMRALTGTLARLTADGDPRLAFVSASIGHVEPELLSARGVPRGWAVSSGRDGRAVFVPAHASQSLDLAADGTTMPGRRWPAPITSEVPWGVDGGALAWNAVDATAHLRSRREGECVSAPASFKPMHAAVAPDGAVYWTDAQAGLWQWTPGHVATRVALLPAAGIPRFEGADLVVAPMPRDAAGRAARQRLRYEWKVDRATGAVDTVATDAAGQCAKVAVGEQCTARSHPCADLVRLERPRAEPVLLACYAPLGVAWAGSSLLVIAGGATVLMFTRLLDQLDALEAGPGLAV